MGLEEYVLVAEVVAGWRSASMGMPVKIKMLHGFHADQWVYFGVSVGTGLENGLGTFIVGELGDVGCTS